MTFRGWDDTAIMEEMGRRFRQVRLNRNLSQAEVAERSGLSTRTVRNIENGENPSLESVIRLMRSLDLVDRLNTMLPEEGPSPMELLKLAGKKRQRASRARQ